MKKSRQKKSYTPSLISEEFGIRSKKGFKELSGKTYAGVEIRGLPKEYPASKIFKTRRMKKWTKKWTKK